VILPSSVKVENVGICAWIETISIHLPRLAPKIHFPSMLFQNHTCCATRALTVVEIAQIQVLCETHRSPRAKLLCVGVIRFRDLACLVWSGSAIANANHLRAIAPETKTLFFAQRRSQRWLVVGCSDGELFAMHAVAVRADFH